MASGASQLMVTFGQKVGITQPSVLNKAEELHRLLTAKGVRGLSTSAEVVICLQLAASSLGEVCDKKACATISGLSSTRYRSQVHTFGQLLDVNQRLSIHDLAVAHSALAAEKLAMAAACEYSRENPQLDIGMPLYQATALAAAAQHLKVKVDKKKLLETTGTAKTVFEKLLEIMKRIVAHIAENEAAVKSSGKRTKTLIEMVEEQIAAEELEDEKETKSSKSNSKFKDEEQDEDEEFEEWKRKVLEG